MASLRHGFEEAGDVLDIRLVVDTIPTLACSLVQTAPQSSSISAGWAIRVYLQSKLWARDGVAIHPDDLPRILETFREALNSVRPFGVEGRPLRDRSGKVAKWYGTNTDIEEWKRAEVALRKREEQWRSVSENSAIGVALTDYNGRFLATNHVFHAIWT
jgi:PAS domain-containing protein